MPLPKPPAETWQPPSFANSITFSSRCLSVMISCSVQEASSRHEWVLCLDDDVLVHEKFLEDLVHDMQQDPAAYMATGAILTFAHPAHCLSQEAALRSGKVSKCGKSSILHTQAILLVYQKGTPASLHTSVVGCITHGMHISGSPDKTLSQSAVMVQGTPLTSLREMPASSHTAAWRIIFRSRWPLPSGSAQCLSGAAACFCRYKVCAMTAMAYLLHGNR